MSSTMDGDPMNDGERAALAMLRGSHLLDAVVAEDLHRLFPDARLIVANSRPGLRRAGHVFGARENIAVRGFSAEGLRRILAEPEFSVTVVDGDRIIAVSLAKPDEIEWAANPPTLPPALDARPAVVEPVDVPIGAPATVLDVGDGDRQAARFEAAVVAGLYDDLPGAEMPMGDSEYVTSAAPALASTELPPTQPVGAIPPVVVPAADIAAEDAALTANMTVAAAPGTSSPLVSKGRRAR